MKFDQLNDDFFREYHKKYPLINSVRGIRELLDRPIFKDFKVNQHYIYLVNQMDRLIQENRTASTKIPDELPGMVYGMWINAWTKLTADMIKEGVLKL